MGNPLSLSVLAPPMASIATPRPGHTRLTIPVIASSRRAQPGQPKAQVGQQSSAVGSQTAVAAALPRGRARSPTISRPAAAALPIASPPTQARNVVVRLQSAPDTTCRAVAHVATSPSEPRGEQRLGGAWTPQLS